MILNCTFNNILYHELFKKFIMSLLSVSLPLRRLDIFLTPRIGLNSW